MLWYLVKICLPNYINSWKSLKSELCAAQEIIWRTILSCADNRNEHKIQFLIWMRCFSKHAFPALFTKCISTWTRTRPYFDKIPINQSFFYRTHIENCFSKKVLFRVTAVSECHLQVWNSDLEHTKDAFFKRLYRSEGRKNTIYSQW